MGPQHSITSAAAALAVWKPKARRVMRRMVAFRPSTRPLLSPRRMAARIPSRWSRMVRPSLTNTGRRERCAQPHHPRTPRRDPRRHPPGTQQRPRGGTKRDHSPHHSSRFRFPHRQGCSGAGDAVLRPHHLAAASREVTTSATHTFFNGPTFLLPDVSGAEARWRLSADGCASVVGEDADVHTIVVDSPFDLVSVEGWAVYERPAPLPRVHLATKVHSLDSDSVLEALASDAGTDVVYVSGAEGRERYGGGTAELMRDESDEASVRVHSVGEGLLVFRDVAASGWIATGDGTPTEMLRADHAFRAAPVPSGWST